MVTALIVAPIALALVALSLPKWLHRDRPAARIAAEPERGPASRWRAPVEHTAMTGPFAYDNGVWIEPKTKEGATAS